MAKPATALRTVCLLKYVAYSNMRVDQSDVCTHTHTGGRGSRTYGAS